MPSDFDGAIIKYDKENNLVSSKHFEHGILSNKTDKIQVKQSSAEGPVTSYAPLPSGCGYIIIDWYWQTYVNGVLVDEEYLYTTQVVLCGDGSGTGGGEGTVCEQAQNFLNEGSVQSGAVSSIDVFNNGFTWKKSYNWMIFHSGTWGLLSYEQATFEKIHYQSNNTNRWEFIDFKHQKITPVGSNIGGTRTFEDLGATINTMPGRTGVWERIDFSVTSTPLNCFASETRAWNGEKLFIAPNTVVMTTAD